MRRVINIYIFSPNEHRGGRGGGAARLFLFSFFPCSAATSGIGHRVNKVVFVGLATNALNVRNNNNNNNCTIILIAMQGHQQKQRLNNI